MEHQMFQYSQVIMFNVKIRYLQLLMLNTLNIADLI